MKPGIYTTEFWMTLGLSVVSLLIALGVVPVADKELVDSAWQQIVVSASSLITSALVVYRYIAARESVKTS